MDVTKKELKIVISAILDHLSQNTEIYFFGSRVDGTSHKSSDLDVLLKGETQINLAKIALIKENIENSDIPFNVDILDYHRCS
ncbi:nucleotidyltransferase domain-containing protein, partial [bacterium]|nr:nucleotidyltransferase domain-containing protein [bacterium]